MEHEAELVLILNNEGYSQHYIGKLLGVNHSTMSELIKCFNEMGTYCRRSGQGQKRCTSARGETFLR